MTKLVMDSLTIKYMTFLAKNFDLVKKTPRSLALKFQCFSIFLFRTLYLKEINIIVYIWLQLLSPLKNNFSIQLYESFLLTWKKYNNFFKCHIYFYLIHLSFFFPFFLDSWIWIYSFLVIISIRNALYIFFLLCTIQIIIDRR